MRLFQLFILVVVVLSCEKEAPTFGIIEAEVNNQLFRNYGYAHRYNDFKNDECIGYDYHIFNLDKNAIYIEVFDSTFNKSSFNYPDFSMKYTEAHLDGSSTTFQAIGGQVNLMIGENGNLSGDFYFQLINPLDDKDTINIENGNFDIPLQNFKRTVN